MTAPTNPESVASEPLREQIDRAINRAFCKVSKGDPYYRKIYAAHMETIAREIDSVQIDAATDSLIKTAIERGIEYGVALRKWQESGVRQPVRPTPASIKESRRAKGGSE